MGQALGCIQVDQSTVAIKETFGKFDDVLEPGCHCLPWCLGSQVAGQLSLRVQQLDVRCETKTKVCCIINHCLIDDISLIFWLCYFPTSLWAFSRLFYLAGGMEGVHYHMRTIYYKDDSICNFNFFVLQEREFWLDFTTFKVQICSTPT